MSTFNFDFKIIESEQIHWLNCKIIQTKIQDSNLTYKVSILTYKVSYLIQKVSNLIKRGLNMEKFIERARAYTNELIKEGGFSYETLSSMTDIPVSTIKNFCSGKTAKNPGFETVSNLIMAMNGDLNDLISCHKHNEHHNDMNNLKETYEMRIADLIKSYEERIKDVKALCEARIADVQKCCDIRISDIKQNYEDRLKEQKELFMKS